MVQRSGSACPRDLLWKHNSAWVMLIFDEAHVPDSVQAVYGAHKEDSLGVVDHSDSFLRGTCFLSLNDCADLFRLYRVP